MFSNVKGTQMNAGAVYVLAHCATCGTSFAVAPDPIFPGQWQFYQREGHANSLTHICAGGLLCLRGHPLDITTTQAVLTQAGEWLNVEVKNVEPVLN